MPQFDLKNAVIKLKDGSTNALTVKLGEGTLRYTEHKNRQYYRDRGKLSDVRDGDEEPVDVSLDFTWEYITGDSDTTVEDALKKRNHASAWVSSDTGDPCQPFAVDIEITYTPICFSAKIETITLSNFRYEQLDHDAKAGTISITGKCNVTEANVERSAQVSS